MGAGAVAAGLGGYKLFASGVNGGENAAKAVMASRTPTYCEICFWKCAGWVHTDETGRIKKITGNDEDQHSSGRLCPRGTGGVGMYYDEARLTRPLIRTEERGAQSFREATWEEALDYIAEKTKAVAEKYGAGSLALFNHGSGGKYFTDLFKALGSDSIAAPSFAQCRGPRDTAFIATFGEQPGSPENTDIRDTRCLVLIGSHIGENMHNGQVQEMSDAIDNGATIITVDPRFSTAAGKSKYWLPVKPATDIALLLAWIHEIVYNNYYDRQYVEKYCYGLEELKSHVAGFTPEWAYGITTINPNLIRETAREMANASPSVIIHPGRHVTWYGDDTQRLRAVAILNALLGSWGRRGGFFSLEGKDLPSYPHPEFPKVTKSWRDWNPGKYNLADSPVSNVLVDASIPEPGRDAMIKAWFVYGTNLPLTIPDTEHTIKAIQNLDFIVAIDTMPMEITGWADVVLPECTYLERYDVLRASPHRKPAIALRMPAREPLGESKPAYWMARELALRLGKQDYFHFEKLEEMLDWQLLKVGSSLEEMKKIGVKTWERETGSPYFADGEDIEFNTNTGKIELYSTSLENEGFDPMPSYTPHPEPPEGYYRLIYGRAPMHTFSRTSNNANLFDLMDENTLWVNPRVAKEWGLSNGQPVYLKNQDDILSDFPIKVRVTERIRWDSVYMVHGFGHRDKKLTRAYGRGASDTQMITNVIVDPVMGGTGMRGNFVTFITDIKDKEAAS